MTVPYCHICDSNDNDKRRYGETGLAEGDYCPVCFEPYCRYHGGTVRWRWRESGKIDSGRVCMQCKNAYRHRDWDPASRDWIS
jgi:hypothetical protein